MMQEGDYLTHHLQSYQTQERHASGRARLRAGGYDHTRLPTRRKVLLRDVVLGVRHVDHARLSTFPSRWLT
jgi:hypothetical protein